MLKKLLKLTVSVSVLMFLLAVTVCAQTMYIANVKDSVYLRKAPASDAYYKTIPVGTAVNSIGWKRGSDGVGYNQVEYKGQRGWVKTEYLSKNKPGSGTTMYIANVKDSVYLRKAPASDEHYTTIPVGAAVNSIGWKRGSDGVGYNQVEYKGQRGWVKTEYLSYGASSSITASKAKEIVRSRKKLGSSSQITAKDMGSYYQINVRTPFYDNGHKEWDEYSCRIDKATGNLYAEAG